MVTCTLKSAHTCRQKFASYWNSSVSTSSWQNVTFESVLCFSLTFEPSPSIAHSDTFQQRGSPKQLLALQRAASWQRVATLLAFLSMIRHKASFTSAAAALGAQAPICFSIRTCIYWSHNPLNTVKRCCRSTRGFCKKRYVRSSVKRHHVNTQKFM